jgi:hypothetical protein
MKKLKGIIVEFGAPVLGLAIPVLASAQLGTAPGGQPPNTLNNINQILGAGSLLCNIVSWVFWIFIVLVVIFVLLAAFKYLTAAGDPEKVKSAGHSLLYAAIAVIVALIARGLPAIVSSIIGGGFNTAIC